MRLFIILGFILSNFFGLSAQCSTIYFYRPDGVIANKTSLKLAQNGENITTLRIGDRVKATACSTGQYRFEAYSDKMLTRGTFNVEISDGQDYYVKVLCPLGSFPSMKVMPISKGEKELQRASKFRGNIRAIRLGAPISQSYTQTNNNRTGNNTPSASAEPQSFIRDQTQNNFRFRIVDVLRAGKRLILNYEVTNLGGQDKEIFVGNTNSSFYDDKGNLLKAKKSCIYNNCVTAGAAEAIYNKNGHFHNSSVTKANVPVGIPIRASIEIGDIRAGSQSFVRGTIFFRARAMSTGVIEDFSFSYGSITLPTDVDPNEPMARVVGKQRVVITTIEQVGDRIRISGAWTNNEPDPVRLRFSRGSLYSDQGDVFYVERAGFGDRTPFDDRRIKGVYSNGLEIVSVNGGITAPFTLYTKSSSVTPSRLQRIDLDFRDYAFSWDNVKVTSGDNQLPAGTTAKAPVTTELTLASTESYVTYDEFSRKASTPQQLTGKKIILENITFDTGSDRLSPSSSPQLRELANLLTRHPLLKVEVSGHTDNVGDEKSNFLLSQQRADAVRYYLIGEGIDPARVASIGRGQTMPIAANITALGRQANRRVELQVQE